MSINIPDDLVKKIKADSCVVFVGSGLSRPELPDWKGLLTKMVDWAANNGISLNPDERTELEKHINENKLLLVAEEIRKRMGKQGFLRFMLDTFRDPKLQPKTTHKLIAQIPFKAIITTNYDVLLESTYTPKPPVFTHSKEAELSEYLHNDKFYIFKAHGDIDDIETVILGRRNYRELPKNSAYNDHLKSVFMTKTVLFIGYSLTDYDMMLLLDDLSTTFKGYTVRHYALIYANEVSSIEQNRFLEDYNIQIIPYESPNKDHREVTEFLTKLSDICRKPDDKPSVSSETEPNLGGFISTTISKDDFHTFISYVHENQEIVYRLCNDLAKSGVKVWSDKNIPVGSRWRNVIRSKIQQGSFFIACFSKEYNEKSKTYMNEELNIAVEELRQRPTDKAWFIPVKLSECDIPDISIGPGKTLKDIQWVELYKDWDIGIQKILDVIKLDKSIHSSLILPPVITNEKDGAEMVLIPAGDFEMGTDLSEIPKLVKWAREWKSPSGARYYDAEPEWFMNEIPRHTVYLDAFYMDVYEVTNAQYKEFMDATGRKAPIYWDDSRLDTPNHPVVNVSWDGANAYAKWAGKRLPTEAEWEKAARGGLVRKRFPWGDEDPDDTRYNFEGKSITPVESYPPNGYGLYDMGGNVWEWCADWYDKGYYAVSPRKNPQGPNSDNTRVLRGKPWNTFHPRYIRVSSRCTSDPSNANPDIGFRCVGL